jgi:Spy/CpxP family protein refolding chaperone
MTTKFKTAAITAAFTLVGAFGLASLPLSAAAQPFTVQGEAAAHPRMVEAIHKMQDAYNELQAAPDDFGGNKAQAMADTRRAIHSLRRALFFRLHLDDAAIDAAVF